MVKEEFKTENFKIEKPSRIDYRKVMYWEPESQELVKDKENGDKIAATILTKAETFLANNCIIALNPYVFTCKPIPGYNKTSYTIVRSCNSLDTWSCNCQGYVSKAKKGEGNCSHILAVKQFLFIEKYNNGV